MFNQQSCRDGLKKGAKIGRLPRSGFVHHDNKLIYAAIQSLAFPGTLREYLYSLQFD